MFLELRHLRTLAALRDTGSLAQAADRLHLTQSALSHQTKVLEDYFGLPLFLRKTRPLRFTPAGLRLLELACEIEYYAYDLYRGLAKRDKDGEAVKTYLLLAEQEMAHVRVISKALNKVFGD